MPNSLAPNGNGQQPANQARFGPHTTEHDFQHHDPSIVRLNHGSFGAPPHHVLKAQNDIRVEWFAQPDSFFFAVGDKSLTGRMLKAKDSVLPLLEEERDADFRDRVAIVDNAAVAVAVICKRWRRIVEDYYKEQRALGTENVCDKPKLFFLDIAYTGSKFCFEEYFDDAEIEFCSISMILLDGSSKPFPQNQHECLARFRAAFADIESSSSAPIFAMLDAVSSQPAFKLPIEQFADLFYEKFPHTGELCVDGAHCVGGFHNFSVKTDCGDPDYFFSNLNKWGFAAPASCVMVAKTKNLMGELRHVIPSWHRGHELGLAQECLWTGSRDYSNVMSLPYAMEFLREWRSEKGESAPEFNHEMLKNARDLLCELWGTRNEYYPEADLFTSCCMIKLPFESLNDRPGQPPQEGKKSLRETLREKHGVEAAISHFAGIGTYVRLSCAVYNTLADVEKFGKAVLAEKPQ